MSTYIKKIQTFQKYFETVFRLGDLSQAICEAACTLKENFTKKLEKLKLPSYVKPEQRYETTFHLYPPKFPRLLSIDFGVALSPPFPYWFVCENYTKIFRKESKKRAEQVVLTKNTLESFKGHLHIGLKHVRVLTHIPEGVEQANS